MSRSGACLKRKHPFWDIPRIALTDDRKGAPLPGYLHCTLPSAAVWDVEMMWGLCFDERPELRLRTTARVRPYRVIYVALYRVLHCGIRGICGVCAGLSVLAVNK
ncbi:MAG: hypothetical protein FWH18_11580 [Marinilabiliaceae bacterium]|nr:hypothetical protein [Marinilabiliaceae bacterium]